MRSTMQLKALFFFFLFLAICSRLFAQTGLNLKQKNSSLYTGIDIGSKGVKMSVLEVGKNLQKNGAFNVIEERSINTDFITFSRPTFQNTLNGLYQLYVTAKDQYNIPSNHIYTVFSSGVVMQAEKENKNEWMKELSDSFKARIGEPQRLVSFVNPLEEARLSHLGIVPEARRYSTFLIDIGSGNTKGGYFPNGNIKDLKLFQVNWGTKTMANAAEKRMEENKTITNFYKQLYRVLEGEPNSEIIYAVNASGAYNMSDNIAISGGIAWSVANLMYPELIDNTVVPVTYNDVVKFSDRLLKNPVSLSDTALIRTITDKNLNKAAIAKELKTVNQVFDQKSLLAGTGLLLRIMRQFEGIYEKKQFYLVKNGQVGWITAFVKQTILNQDNVHE